MKLTLWLLQLRRGRPRSTWEIRREWHPLFGDHERWIEHRPEHSPLFRSRPRR